MCETEPRKNEQTPGNDAKAEVTPYLQRVTPPFLCSKNTILCFADVWPEASPQTARSDFTNENFASVISDYAPLLANPHPVVAGSHWIKGTLHLSFMIILHLTLNFFLASFLTNQLL